MTRSEETRVQVACDRCTQGVMDATNSHRLGTCQCACHTPPALPVAVDHEAIVERYAKAMALADGNHWPGHAEDGDVRGAYREMAQRALASREAERGAGEDRALPPKASEPTPSEMAEMTARKDAAYLERNQVVAALAKVVLASGGVAGIKRTAIEGWSDDWHGCVYIDTPWGQASWHYHDSHASLFVDLPAYAGEWDGHSTEEKYARLGMPVPAAPQASDPEAVAWKFIDERMVDGGLLTDDRRVMEAMRTAAPDALILPLVYAHASAPRGSEEDTRDAARYRVLRGRTGFEPTIESESGDASVGIFEGSVAVVYAWPERPPKFANLDELADHLLEPAAEQAAPDPMEGTPHA